MPLSKPAQPEPRKPGQSTGANPSVRPSGGIRSVEVHLSDLSIGDVLDFIDHEETIIAIETLNGHERRVTLRHNTTGDERQSVLRSIGMHRVCGGPKVRDSQHIRINRAGVRLWTPEVRA